MKAKTTLKDKAAAAVEAAIYPDQREVEGTLLATLATVINSDVADLKYSLLELTATDFHFRDHQTTFAAMKKLADAGDHIDMVTVRAEVGDAWPETLKAVFDPSKASTSAAETYKQKIIFWSNIREARQIGQDYLSTVDNAASADDADLPGLIAGLQKTVFDMAKTDALNLPTSPWSGRRSSCSKSI